MWIVLRNGLQLGILVKKKTPTVYSSSKAFLKKWTLECVGLLSHFTLFLRLTIPHICTPVQLENLCFSCVEYYNIYLSKNIWHNNCANVAKLGFHNQILRIQIGFFGPSFSSFFLIIWRSQVSAMDIFILHMAFYFSGFKQYLHQKYLILDPFPSILFSKNFQSSQPKPQVI